MLLYFAFFDFHQINHREKNGYTDRDAGNEPSKAGRNPTNDETVQSIFVIKLF